MERVAGSPWRHSSTAKPSRPGITRSSHDHAWGAGDDLGERLLAVARLTELEPVAAKRLGDEPADRLVVVDDEDRPAVGHTRRVTASVSRTAEKGLVRKSAAAIEAARFRPFLPVQTITGVRAVAGGRARNVGGAGSALAHRCRADGVCRLSDADVHDRRRGCRSHEGE